MRVVVAGTGVGMISSAARLPHTTASLTRTPGRTRRCPPRLARWKFAAWTGTFGVESLTCRVSVGWTGDRTSRLALAFARLGHLLRGRCRLLCHRGLLVERYGPPVRGLVPVAQRGLVVFVGCPFRGPLRSTP